MTLLSNVKFFVEDFFKFCGLFKKSELYVYRVFSGFLSSRPEILSRYASQVVLQMDRWGLIGPQRPSWGRVPWYTCKHQAPILSFYSLFLSFFSSSSFPFHQQTHQPWRNNRGLLRGQSQTMLTKFLPLLTTYLPTPCCY